MDCSSESTILIGFGARQDCSSSENALFEGKGAKANPKIKTGRKRFICWGIRFFVMFYYISYPSKVNDYLATGCGYCLRLKAAIWYKYGKLKSKKFLCPVFVSPLRGFDTHEQRLLPPLAQWATMGAFPIFCEMLFCSSNLQVWCLLRLIPAQAFCVRFPAAQCNAGVHQGWSPELQKETYIVIVESAIMVRHATKWPI